MKELKLSNYIVSAIFLIIIAVLLVGTGIDAAKPMAKDVLKVGSVGLIATRNKLTDELNDDVFVKNKWIDLYGFTQLVMGKYEVGNYDVIKDEAGFLHREYNESKAKNMDSYVDNLAALYGVARANDADFLFIETPSDIIPGKTVFPQGISYPSSDENITKFVKKSEALGIPTLDARAQEDGLSLDEIFYKTDHHWALPMTFKTYAATIAKLNELYKMDLDPEGIYTDVNNYEKKVWKDGFLGSVGIRNGRYYAGMDDFMIYVPKFETDLTFEKWIKHKLKEEKSGDFWEAFIDESSLVPDHMNKYQANLYNGDDENIVKNHANKNGLKCLLISDSFGRTYTEYLSLCFEETVYIDPSQEDRFQGNITEYIEKYNPDVIIAMPSGDHIWNPLEL